MMYKLIIASVVLALWACGSDSSGNAAPADESASSSSVNAEGISSAAVASSSSVNATNSSSSSAKAEAQSSSTEASCSSVQEGSSSSLFISSGTFKDERDGQNYKMVTIGSQTWMAQNLNYADSSSKGQPNLIGNSWCGGKNTATGDDGDCDTYGRLYSWTAVMNVDSIYKSKDLPPDTLTENWQGACPNGWHVPTQGEWDTLYYAVLNDFLSRGAYDSEAINKSFRSKSSLWVDSVGTDLFGFALLPAGQNFGTFEDVGHNATLWSASQAADGSVFEEQFWDNYRGLACYGDKSYALSVRCVKN